MRPIHGRSPSEGRARPREPRDLCHRVVMSLHPDAWLVVIDPQRIFADPASQWGSPMFPAIVDPVRRLAARLESRTIVTRWVAPAAPEGSWADYLKAWPFADVPADDPLFDIVDEVA